MKIVALCTTLAAFVFFSFGPAFATDADELKSMLQEFLNAVDREAAHDVFWAEDLVYTSSAGLRFGKAEIMSGFEDSVEGSTSADVTPSVVYSGSDVDIRLYGDTAVIAFKLIATPTDESTDSGESYYFNTGTFLKREGVWQVIAWQATRIPAAEE